MNWEVWDSLIVLNFSHPLTREQLAQLEEQTAQKLERVIEVDAHIDPGAPLAPQVAAMVERAGLSPVEWQTRPVLVNPPSLNFSTAVLLAELHGRCGYFPPVVRLRPVPGAVPPRFEVAEVLNLQAVRDAARQQRQE